MANTSRTPKTVETLHHTEDKRKNIPTAEHRSVLQKEQEAPRTVKYPRNTDLDPQLVWRGKDEQDWSDLVVHVPPLYIQEKVNPKVLIDDLRRVASDQWSVTGHRSPATAHQIDLFADFNGIPEGVDRTEFYQHDQNWSKRMILGDSLQVMASLAEREGLRGKVQCIYVDPPRHQIQQQLPVVYDQPRRERRQGRPHYPGAGAGQSLPRHLARRHPQLPDLPPRPPHRCSRSAHRFRLYFRLYVVQTASRAIERCVLLTTDPGDLVLDPTCGSGTAAYVAEQWGRRWITIDTSRVALALARARIMGARYPYYLLADSREGQRKEAELSGRVWVEKPTYGSVRHGFVNERVPHITLKSIANNAEIDVIWEKWQQILEPLREQLNQALVGWAEARSPSIATDALPSSAHPTKTFKLFEEWEIPREADKAWLEPAKKLHVDWWEARIARQKEIDASIAAKAEFEYLYDKPYEDKKKVRVAGPFTFESLSPHRVLGVDENDELIDPLKLAEDSADYAPGRSFEQMILENLKTAGVQQAHKDDRITFTSIAPWPGDMVCAEGRYREGDSEKRAAIFIGPEFGTVSRPDLVAAAREAGDAGFDVLIACAFNYEAHATEFRKLGRIPVLKARMNADLLWPKTSRTPARAIYSSSSASRTSR